MSARRRNWTEAELAQVTGRTLTMIERLNATILQPLSRGRIRLGTEDKLSADVFEFMKDALESGRYVGVFTHVANEANAGNDRLAGMYQHKKKLIGMVPGATDWWFLWRCGAGVIELKSKGLDGSLSDNQAVFRDWCDWAGIRHEVCNRLTQVEKTLERWGALAPKEG